MRQLVHPLVSNLSRCRLRSRRRRSAELKAQFQALEMQLRVHGNSAASRDIATLLHPYTNLKTHQSKGPLIITGGRGVYVRDDQGKEYLEGLAGLWCVSLGFSEPRLVEAARRQMETL